MASTEPAAALDPRLRRRAAAAFALATLATLAAGAAVGAAVGAGPLYPLKAAALLPVLAALAVPALPLHGRTALGWANAVTLARAGLAGLVAGFLGEPSAAGLGWGLAGAALVGFALDGLDGHVARATGGESPFGARLDMELDALTVLALAALVLQLGHAGAWVLAAGLLRYAFVAAAHVLPWLGHPLFPSERRRVACGLGVVGLAVALAPLPQPLPALAAAGGVAALAASFAVDGAWLFAHRRAA